MWFMLVCIWATVVVVRYLSSSIKGQVQLVMDREAWRAAVHGVAKSQTQLSNWTEQLNTCFQFLLTFCLRCIFPSKLLNVTWLDFDWPPTKTNTLFRYNLLEIWKFICAFQPEYTHYYNPNALSRQRTPPAPPTAQCWKVCLVGWGRWKTRQLVHMGVSAVL